MNYNYKLFFQSGEGKNAISVFSLDNEENHIEEILNLYNENITTDIEQLFDETLSELLAPFLELNISFEQIYFSFINFIYNERFYDIKDVICYIPSISLHLYAILEDSHFYPILYNENFYLFEKACRVLGIEIPSIPAQAMKEERIIFYNKLCLNIEAFRVDNELTKAEVCALLYEYAPRVFKSNDYFVDDVLPSPENIRFIGGAGQSLKSKRDADYKNLEEADYLTWQCNKETLRGDIIIMFAHNKGHIHSIWRAMRDATTNPFGYYADRIEIGHKIIVPHVTLKDLQQDDILGKSKPVVGNMQALYQKKPISVNEYKALQKLFVKLDSTFDLNILPQILSPDVEIELTAKKENEVSEGILIPYLRDDLGYDDKDGVDWKRELQLKLGRNRNEDEEKDGRGYKARPDFAFFPKNLQLDQKYAPFIIEVKYDMTNSSEFESAVAQAASYARILHSSRFGVCDKHRIAIFSTTRDYFTLKDKVLEYTWKELLDKNNPQPSLELRKLINKEAILRLDKYRKQ